MLTAKVVSMAVQLGTLMTVKYKWKKTTLLSRLSFQSVSFLSPPRNFACHIVCLGLVPFQEGN